LRGRRPIVSSFDRELIFCYGYPLSRFQVVDGTGCFGSRGYASELPSSLGGFLSVRTARPVSDGHVLAGHSPLGFQGLNHRFQFVDFGFVSPYIFLGSSFLLVFRNSEGTNEVRRCHYRSLKKRQIEGYKPPPSLYMYITPGSLLVMCNYDQAFAISAGRYRRTAGRPRIGTSQPINNKHLRPSLE